MSIIHNNGCAISSCELLHPSGYCSACGYSRFNSFQRDSHAPSGRSSRDNILEIVYTEKCRIDRNLFISQHNCSRDAAAGHSPFFEMHIPISFYCTVDNRGGAVLSQLFSSRISTVDDCLTITVYHRKEF